MKPTRKLQLDRESLHELTNEELTMVAGGADDDTWLCPSNIMTCPSGDDCTFGCTYRELCDLQT